MNAMTETTATRTREVWPRLADWLDTVVPSDLSWRTGFPHSMRVEEFTRNGSFVVRAELPGIDPDSDVDITIRDRMLTIAGKREESHEAAQRSEFFYGRFMRTLSLPTNASTEDIRATYLDGILEVEVPLREPDEAVQRVEVSRSQ
jgi:HSP20 family protein